MTQESASPQSPISFEQVLDDEYRLLHGSARSSHEEVHRRHEEAGHGALCLSGGGVRSASFGLGVLQGLARAGVLQDFDYLSTVSGGGYIGGWFSAWRLRARDRREVDPAEQLAADTEPATVTRLRDLIKFLDPHGGVRSADVWTLGGTILRNLLVMWLVLIPLIAFGAMVPRLYLGVLGLPSQPELVSRATLDWWYEHDWIPIVLLIAVATMYAARELPSLGNRSRGTRSFVAWFLLPVLLVEALLSIHHFWASQFGTAPSRVIEVAMAAIAMVLPWIIGGFGRRWWRPWTWLAAAGSGLTGRLLTSAVHGFLSREADVDPQLFCVIDLPISLALLFLQFSAFVGLASRDMTDEDREWWARSAAWILLAASGWLLASAIVILGPIGLDWMIERSGVSREGGRAAFGLLTLLSGGGAYWVGARSALGSAGWKKVHAVALALAAPLAVLLLVVLVADVDRMLLDTIHRMNPFHELPHPVGASLPEDLLALGGLLFVGLALGRVVSVNQFSLHDMYRARLVRTFLGVSRQSGERTPNRFTGFDANDDLRFEQLTTNPRPLHIVNATLDLVADHRLATAQTKAASFTMTPLHVGSRHLRYRTADSYAGGLSLGQAMTTSGAAVSPNMGAASSPARTFLLAVLNARLGIWLGNPGMRGAATWTRPAPGFGVATLVNELFGRTTDRNPYVYLSDGGHFENLGLYEVIARRCRYVIVSDAGADEGYCFDDLANAIRLVRIDFGVEIEFPSGVRIGPPGTGVSRWAVGTIRYKAVDPLAEDGVLIYLKPTLIGDESVDIANYARAHASFPQESTVNQWFDTPQFESYRTLGLHTVTSLCANRQFATVKDLCLAVRGGVAYV
jgi:Patatin-like phospholipase